MWRGLPSLLFTQRYGLVPSVDMQLTGPRLTLRMGDPGDWRQWRKLREASQAFLKPWEPSWPDNALTYGFFCGLLRRQWRDWRQGRGYAFLIFLQAGHADKSDALVGSVTLNDVQRGIAQKGILGYWMGESYAGQGYMTEAARLVCAFAFDTLRLHRIEASCLPHNEPSKALLRRLGFDEEGYARAYLQIDGRRQDHLLWGQKHESAETGRRQCRLIQNITLALDPFANPAQDGGQKLAVAGAVEGDFVSANDVTAVF